MSQSSPAELSLREQAIEHARALHGDRLTVANSGNLSIRSQRGLLITPSGVPYGALAPADMVEMSLGGERLSGTLEPSSEWRFHRDIYLEDDGVNAVVHAHSPAATALSALRTPLPPFHYMVALAGGRQLPCSGYATFGTEALSHAVLKALSGGYKACLMANHGMLTTGESLPAAYRLALEMESLCDMYLRARQAGEVVLLSDAEMDDAARAFAGYGQRKDRVSRAEKNSTGDG